MADEEAQQAQSHTHKAKESLWKGLRNKIYALGKAKKRKKKLGQE